MTLEMRCIHDTDGHEISVSCDTCAYFGRYRSGKGGRCYKFMVGDVSEDFGCAEWKPKAETIAKYPHHDFELEK